MRTLRKIAVFCGSNFGSDEVFRTQAVELGHQLAHEGIDLVYGGTQKGTMGVLADAFLEGGGSAHGVITQRLHDKGHTHPGLSQIEIVSTLRERKQRMIDNADAFIALPGGIGTLEELLSVWSLNQLDEIDKPFGALDVGGYYQPLVNMIDKMIADGFLPEAHRHSIVVQPGAIELLQGLRSFVRVSAPKWLPEPDARTQTAER